MKFRSVVWIVGVLWVGNTIRAEPPSPSATFTKDVLPILQKNCQDCHRPGQLAPMSFLTYRETRPWARAMKLAVISKKMPPWFADSHYGHFLNDRSLSQRDIDTIGAWADAGAPEGDGKDAPQPRVWPLGGWIIEPDLVIKGPEYTVPAHTTNDVMEWTYVTVPSGITKDTWVTSMEIRPDKLAVTHHMCIFFRPHTPDVVYNKAVWVDKPRDASGHVLPKATGAGRRPSFITAGSENPNTEGCYVPGKSVED